MAERVKVGIVDDSAVVRQVLSSRLSQERDFEVVFAASDPILARQRMDTVWPDVLVLDVEMPRMDGITFLRQLMAERPLPVVICSTLTHRGAETTLQALEAGALAFVTKPTIGLKEFLTTGSEELVNTIRGASKARPRRPAAASTASTNTPLRPAVGAMQQTTDRIVAIGTSTGGTQALEAVLTRLPRVVPGIVIVQHMPEKFTEMFAARLNQISELEVREARSGDRIIPGRALVAPGGRHLRVRRDGAFYIAEVLDGPPVNRHRPSVDVLFRSVAEQVGRNALGIIMTGMGDDGARGMLQMHQAGAHCIAQDEASCVVFGMPMEAIKLKAVDDILPLDRLPQAILDFGGRNVPHHVFGG